MTDAASESLHAQIQAFYDIQRLIKHLESINKTNRETIHEQVCRDAHVRRTAESVRDGWVYDTGTHRCTVRPSIRQYIDKEQLPSDVYQQYSQLQEILTLSVTKHADEDEEDEPGEVVLHFPSGRCTYSPTAKRRVVQRATS